MVSILPPPRSLMIPKLVAEYKNTKTLLAAIVELSWGKIISRHNLPGSFHGIGGMDAL